MSSIRVSRRRRGPMRAGRGAAHRPPRVAVLLEAAGLLSLLDRAGWRLAAGWEGARISAAGRLVVAGRGPRAGRPARPRSSCSSSPARLFGDGAVAGRGRGAAAPSAR